jgi:hypothetical protein
MKNTAENENLLNVAIGEKISLLLNLKINKQGKVKTSYGDKTWIGLGATVLSIIKEETENQLKTQ